MKIIKEACVETEKQAEIAFRNGADRIELCGDLSVGGITPDFTAAAKLHRALPIPVKVMVRPRGGDFVYSAAEFARVLEEIKLFKSIGIPEVVLGFLTAENKIDVAKTKRAVAAAMPMRVTFHKAIDDTPDIIAAVKTLKNIPGITSILSSGGRVSAIEGVKVLVEMKAECGEKLTLIAAGKISPQVLPDLVQMLGAGEYHGRRIV